MIDPVTRGYDQVHHLGEHGWRDLDSEGRVRHVLLGLRVQGLLNRKALLTAMASRGHGTDALQRLDRLVDKTYREPGPNPETSD